MSELDVDELVARAASANASKDITGALVVAGSVFFQLLEGPAEEVDRLFARIRDDARHTDVLCLDAQTNREIRLFPHWSMRRVGQSTSASSTRMRALVEQLSQTNADQRATLIDEVAGLMRDAIRAA